MFQTLLPRLRNRGALGLLVWLAGLMPAWAAGVGPQIVQNGRFSLYRSTFTPGTNPVTTSAYPLPANTTDLGAWRSGVPYAQTDVDITTRGQVTVQLGNASYTAAGASGIVQRTLSDFSAPSATNLVTGTTNVNTFLLYRGAAAAASIWYQNLSVLPNTTYTVSYFASNAAAPGKTGTAPQLSMQYTLNGGAATTLGTATLAFETATDSWTQYTYTFTTAATTTNVEMRLLDPVTQTTVGTDDKEVAITNIVVKAAVASAGTAFSCDGVFYQIRQTANTAINGYAGNSSQLFRVNRTTTPFTTTLLQELGATVNGLSYNPSDGFMYCLTYRGNTSGDATSAANVVTPGFSAQPSTYVEISRIGQGGIESLGFVKGLPVNQWAGGTVDRGNTLYLKSQDYNNQLYKLDLSATPVAATLLTLTGSYDAKGNLVSYDLAFDPIGNLLYGVYQPGIDNNTAGALYQINPASGAVTAIGNVNLGNAANNAKLDATQPLGSAFFDLAGNLYAYGNGPAVQTATSGKFYRISKTTGVATTLNTINGATNSDGASCINPSQTIDVVKQLVAAQPVAGNLNQRDVTYRLYLRNTGTVTDNNVQVSDFLWGSSKNVTFPTATGVTLQSLAVDNTASTPNPTLTTNPAYTGQGTAVGATAATSPTLAALLDPSKSQVLTAGQQVLITFTVRVTFPDGQVPTAVQNNTAYATDAASSNPGYSQATDGDLDPPGDLTATDASTNGSAYPALRNTGTTDAAAPTPVTFTPALAGTVYEDANYGGGSGRTLSASGGAVVPGARVELYNGSGTGATYVTSTVTDANGNYVFSNLTVGGSYTVRVVNSTVTSTRAGAAFTTATFTPPGSTTALTYRTSTQLGVQTYRYNDTERVGGEYPAYADAAAVTAVGTTLGSLTSDTNKKAAESLVAVTLPASNATGTTAVNFGYNFDTVVNTADAGQGSLRQFILNANALANSGLAQSGSRVDASGATVALPTANNEESSIFMIPDGKQHAGLKALDATTSPGLTNQLTASGVAAIVPATALPALASTSGTNGAYTRIDGTTQTLNIGNTNNLTLGAGGVVGTGLAAATLGQLNGPEVQLSGTSALATGVDVASTGNNATVTGLAIYGFGNTPGTGSTGNVRSAGANVTITGNLIGDPATTFDAPNTASNNISNGGEDVRLQFGANNNVISNNLIGYANGKGVIISSGVTGVTVQGNEIRGNGLTNSSYDGVGIQGSSATVLNNLLTGNTGQGIDSYLSAGSNTISGNTISGNGGGSVAGVQAATNPSETAGVRLYGSNNSLQQNVIAGNYGAGIQLAGTTTAGGTTYPAVASTLISQNSIYGNGSAASATGGRAASGQVGIDLQADSDYNAATNGGTTTTTVTAAGDPPYVTYNNGSGTAGANGLLNYPILQTATVVGNNLHVTGYAKAGAKIELFLSQPNAVTGTQGSLVGNNFGQGKTYLTTVTEGVGDTDASTGQSYGQNNATINGFYQGSDTNANGFSFDIPLSSLPAGVLTGGSLAAGTVLTSTATLSGATSEFSGNVTTTVTAPLTGYVYEDVNYGGGLGRARANAAGSAVVAGALVELYDGSGNYVASAVTNASGQYSFNALPGTGYTVRVVDNTVASTRTGATATSSTFTPSGSSAALTYRTSTQLAVQTYNGSTNHVGGQNPYNTDAAANTTGATLASLTSGTTLPQSVATGITVGAGTTANAGTDFGFNFDAIVNNNDGGQGSLRQFITNSNALGGETTLAQVYTKADGTTTALTSGLETSIFMIPNGQAVPGQAAGLPNKFAATATGSAITIAPATTLPVISGPLTALDGSTQTRSTGDTNAADYTTANAETTGPEVLIDLGYRAASGGTAAVAGVNAVAISGNGDKVLYLGIANSATSSEGITLNNTAVNTTISNSTLNNNDANITFNTYTTSATAPASAATITGNVIRNTRSGNNDGIELNGGNSNLTISGNYILRNAGNGIDYVQGANLNNKILNNIFVGNGTATGNAQLSGVAIRGAGSNNNVVTGNTFTGNNGAGIVAVGNTTGNVFSQNSYYGNGLKADGTPVKTGGQGLAIDLAASTDANAAANGDGVTKNDNGDTDTGANGLLNFPVITSATIVGNTLVVKGYARPGSIIELYNPGPVADNTKFGEGQTYLGTVTEGGAAGATAGGSATALAGTATNLASDDDGGSGTYGPGLINGLDQGTDNTNKFSFTIPLPAGYVAGSLLSSTATAKAESGATVNSTSEFSGNVPVNAVPVAVDVTNVSVPRNAGATTLSPNLSALINGSYDAVQYYTLTSLPATGTLSYNGTVLTSANLAGTQLTPALLNTLKYTPDPAGTAASTSFQYTVTDTNGFTSTTHALADGSAAGNGPATYTIPLDTPPVASTTTNTFQNPGSTKTVAVPAAAFAGTDADGTVSSLTLTSFPANATSFTVTTGTVSTTYTSANFPAAGLTLTTTSTGNLPSGTTLAVDPVNAATPGGTVAVVFSYKVTDNNGAVSDNTGTATLTYTDLTIAGTVYNDVNGGTNSAIDGLATGTPGGTQVYATLVSGAGNVLGSVAVASNGTYLLGTGNGVQTSTSFVVVLSTLAGTVGSPVTASVPAGYVNTAEGTATAGDGTPDGRTSVAVATAPVTGVNFGVEKLAVPSQTTVAASNPGGTGQYAVPGTSFSATDESAGGVTGSTVSLTLTTFPTGATTVVINGTSYTATTFAAASVAARTLATNADGTLATGQTLTVDPTATGATQVVVSYVVKDNAGLTSPAATPGTVTLNFGDLTIAGTVYSDPNGTSNGAIDGTATGTAGGSQLYALLVSSAGKVVASQAVSTVAATAGQYSFGNANGVLANTSYTVQLSTTAGTVGNTSVLTLPTGFVNTAETGDATPDGKASVTTTTTAVSGVNFGIEQRPSTTATTTVAVGTNPGGTGTTSVPATGFSGTDPDNSPITNLTITAFPTNATSFTVTTGGVATTYTSANFPAAGLTLAANGSGNPTSAIVVDPVDGAPTVTFTYKEVDAAGYASAATGALNLTFADLTLAGTVFNDVNGLSDNTVNGTGAATYGGNAVYVNLVNASTNAVLASVAAGSNGGYSFGSANGLATGSSYNVVLTSAAQTVGSTLTAASTPTGYASTGEGTATAGDGTPNGLVALGTLSASTSGVNFGLDQLAVPGTNTIAASNPGGTGQYAVPGTSFSGTDESIGGVTGSTASLTLTTFPTGATTVVINGTSYTSATFPAAGVKLTTNANGSLATGQTLTVDPTAIGATQVVVSYVVTDNAGLTSPTATPGNVTLNFGDLTIAGTVYNDVNGLSDNTVNGTGAGTYGATNTQVYVSLVNATTNKVVAVATVATDGSYSFGNADGVAAGTSYNLVATTTAPAVGATLTAATAPAGYGFTGDYNPYTATNDAPGNGVLNLGAVTTSTTAANFGLELRPTAGTLATQAVGANPGGTNLYAVPATYFSGTDNDPNVSSPAGAIASLIISSFPSNTTTLVVNGLSYTSATFPAAGLTLTTNADGSLASGQTVSIDPNNGAFTVTISYKVTDNGGLTSTNTGAVPLKFTDLTLGGTVYNDVNGGTVNGTGQGVYPTGGTPVYVNVVNTATGNVVAVATPAANGLFSVGTAGGIMANTDYTLVLSTTKGTVGSPAPDATAPAGYDFTGEGLSATPDGTADGMLAVSVGTTSIATLRFGLDKLPTAGTATIATTNPGGTTQYLVPATSFTGTDVDPNVTNPAGAITKLTITAFPANATSIVLNGTTYTAATFPAAGVSVATNGSGNPTSAITVDPVDGTPQVVLSYTVTDNAGQPSASAGSITINFQNAADVTTALDGPTQLPAGQPSGTYTASFANVGLTDASSVTRTVTLPAGATLTTAQLSAIAAQGGTVSGTSIDFGTVGTLAAGASQAFTFSFTAPTTAGAAVVKSTTSTTNNEGANVAPNSSTINATVNTVADVVAAIAPISATVAAGQPNNVGFNVTFSNGGALTAAGVTRTVQLQPGLTGVAVTGGGTYDPATGLVSYPATTIANGSPLTSAITFTAPASGPVAAVASVSTTSNEAGQTANNVATASLTVTPAFDLTTTISGPASATAGNETMLTVTSTNNGPSAATGVVETVQLVSGLTNVYVSNGGVYNPGTSTQSLTVNGVTYSVAAGAVVFPTIASLPGGQTLTNTISFTTPAVGTVLAPVATVAPNATADGETNPNNNTAYLNGAASSTNLTINPATTDKANAYTTITAASQTVSAGQAVTLTVVAGNAGPKPAGDFTQTVQLLPGLSGSLAISGLTSSYNATTGKLTFSDNSVYDNNTGMLTSPSYGTVASAYTRTTTISFTAPANAGNNGQLLLSSAVTTSTSEVVLADNFSSTVVMILPTADVATSVAGPATAVAGQAVAYTATYGNNGPGPASSVTRTAQLPPNLTGVVVTDAATGLVVSGAYNAATGLVTLPTLASEATGARQAYTIAFVAPGTSFTVSTATATTTPDGTTSNNAATVLTTVTPTADLAVVASGPATAVVGNAVTYFVTTTNNGPDPAASVATTLQLPTGLPGVAVSNGGSYDTNSGLVTFTSAGTLASGASVADYVTFTMPNATGGQLSGVATATTTSTDPLTGNNKSSVATSVAPATTTSADLSTTVAFSAATVAAGTTGVSVTATFGNNGPDAATNVAPTLQLPAGLAGVSASNGGSYDPATGLVTWPVVASLASGTANTLSYTVSFTAPGSGPVRATSAIASQTSDVNPANNSASSTLAITATYDAVTTLSGPASSLPGVVNTYTVTASNNGPSPAPSVQQTVTLPSGVTATNISGGGTQSGNVITWPAIANQQPGTAGAVSYTFGVAMPSSGSLNLTAAVTAAGESNTTKNGATLTTTPANQPPVAANVVNALQAPQGSTANQLFISPLQATDADGMVQTYQLAGTLPNATTQGKLYYNNNADGVSGAFVALPIAQDLTPAQAAHLRFDPVTGYAGNVFFSYTATDNLGAVSNPALYTIPVGIDNASAYAYTPNKGGSTAYATGDVLAYVIDANGAKYNASGAMYDATTGKLSPVGSPSNGVTSAVLTPTAGAGSAPAPAGNASNTLPTGVAINPATGQLYVQDASKLPAITTATTYSVNVTTTDVNGGLTTQLVQFTIGGYPLPVELTTFEAKAVQNRDGLLTWVTATEHNSDHFDLERSLDGQAFVKIGQVGGQGTKFSETHYTYTDAGIGRRVTGQVYYRLRQVDFDGTSAYSGVRVVTFTGNVAAAISLYPNPATASTTLDLTALPAANTYQVLLLDATGRQVRSFAQAGSLAQRIDLSGLATGTYNVLVTGTQADGSLLRQVFHLTKE